MNGSWTNVIRITEREEIDGEKSLAHTRTCLCVHVSLSHCLFLSLTSRWKMFVFASCAFSNQIDANAIFRRSVDGMNVPSDATFVNEHFHFDLCFGLGQRILRIRQKSNPIWLRADTWRHMTAHSTADRFFHEQIIILKTIYLYFTQMRLNWSWTTAHHLCYRSGMFSCIYTYIFCSKSKETVKFNVLLLITF